MMASRRTTKIRRGMAAAAVEKIISAYAPDIPRLGFEFCWYMFASEDISLSPSAEFSKGFARLVSERAFSLASIEKEVSREACVWSKLFQFSALGCSKRGGDAVMAPIRTPRWLGARAKVHLEDETSQGRSYVYLLQRRPVDQLQASFSPRLYI